MGFHKNSNERRRARSLTRPSPDMSITRRDVLKTTVLGSLAAATDVKSLFGQARGAAPNIVYIMAYDLGYADVAVGR